jgi:hypothetical protein
LFNYSQLNYELENETNHKNFASRLLMLSFFYPSKNVLLAHKIVHYELYLHSSSQQNCCILCSKFNTDLYRYITSTPLDLVLKCKCNSYFIIFWHPIKFSYHSLCCGVFGSSCLTYEKLENRLAFQNLKLSFNILLIFGNFIFFMFILHII